MPDVHRIRQSLAARSIADAVIDRITEGYEAIPDKAPKKIRAPFLAQVIGRLDATLDAETVREIMDWCACCKSGVRERNVRRFAEVSRGQSLAERIPGLWNVPNMGRPVLNDNGTIESGISWKDNDVFRCACPCFSGVPLKDPVSVTYCYCCAGHFRHHYQNALGVQLKTKAVLSSPLESLGTRPCRFLFEVVE